MTDIKIPIDSITGDFKNFLEVEGNSRIFFSGRFGIGKTYFLKEFFKIYSNEYEFFHLFPVNYQLNCNEDILELIKYDILVELLKKNDDIFNDNKIKGIKSSSLLFYSWCKNKFSLNSFLQYIISSGEVGINLLADPVSFSLGKLGRPLKDLLDIDKEFQEFKNEFEKGEKGIIERFKKEIEEKDIREDDYLSYLLRSKIENQKGEKKSILILDDLDRIDPEHVFRILNILSAYFEKEGENKFGFDSIIIVADYENIENIFFHKYGNQADFSGYLDKFFTLEPYFLNNKKIISDYIPKLIEEVKCKENNLKDAFNKESGTINLLFSDILRRSLEVGGINLR